MIQIREYTKWIYNRQYTVAIQVVEAQLTLNGQQWSEYYQYQITDAKTGMTVRDEWGFTTLAEVYHEIALDAKYHLNKEE